MKRNSAKRITMLAVMTALALITFIIEGLFPPLFVPGAKMGLSNIFSLITIIILGPIDAIVVVAARTLIGSLFGNFSALIYSIVAGIISVLVEIILIYTLYPRISLLAVSVAGAVLHNLTQNIIYMLVSGSAYVMSYSPYLVIVGTVSGLIVGAAAYLIIKKVPMRSYLSLHGYPLQEKQLESY